MKKENKSQLLFFMGCIPMRLLLVYIAYLLSNNNSNNLNINLTYSFSLITFLIGLSFALIYMKGWRKTGRETFGQKIWWNDLRPIHSFLYITFSISLLMKKKWCWMILLLDVLIGIYAELFYKNKNI